MQVIALAGKTEYTGQNKFNTQDEKELVLLYSFLRPS